MVEQWVKDLCAECGFKQQFDVGDIVRHPSGRIVLIVAGTYWEQGGFSNFWYWHEAFDDGTFSIKRESGYGWSINETG